jgi:hypothetical protein
LRTRAIFDAATRSRRYLLTFKGCGYAIGLDPAPAATGRSRNPLPGSWIAPGPVGYGAYRPGFYGVTVWKGFQRNHVLGLELIQSNAESRAD